MRLNLQENGFNAKIGQGWSGSGTFVAFESRICLPFKSRVRSNYGRLKYWRRFIAPVRS